VVASRVIRVMHSVKHRRLARVAPHRYHACLLCVGTLSTNSCNKFLAAGLLLTGRSPGFCICAAGRGPRAGPWRRPLQEEAFHGIALSAIAENFLFLNPTLLFNESSSNPKASKSSKCASTTSATAGNPNGSNRLSKQENLSGKRSLPAANILKLRTFELPTFGLLAPGPTCGTIELS
jgi:hypothetical protein